LEVVWWGAALDDLVAIADYLVPLNPFAADRIVTAIERAGESLTEFPHRGQSAGIPGLRRLLVHRTNYHLLYRVRDDHQRVEIVRIIDGRQVRVR
jgi:plasmid stabilization system protein ParE